jgi:phosphoenolpyruvate carboxylase
MVASGTLEIRQDRAPDGQTAPPHAPDLAVLPHHYRQRGNVLAKTDLFIARRYAQLPRPESRGKIFPGSEEYRRTVRGVPISAAARIFSTASPCSIDPLRNEIPTSILNFLQIRFCRKWRTSRTGKLLALLQLTVGIAVWNEKVRG